MKRITVFATALALSPLAFSGVGAWTSNGPEGIQGLDIAVTAAAPDVILVASAGGIFKSINAGASWVRSGGALNYVNQVWISPTNPNLYLALTYSRLYRSTNAGASWTAFGTGLPAAATASLGRISIDASNPNNVMVVDYVAGIFRSTNGGANFSATSIPAPVGAITGYQGVAIDPIVPSRVFVSVCNNDTSALIYRSTDSGVSFSPVASTNAVAGGDCAEGTFAFNTLAPGTLLNGLARRSTDGGLNFSLPLGFVNGGGLTATYRNGTSELYVGSRVGIQLSTNNGDSYTAFGTGLVDNGTDTSAIQTVAFKPGAVPVVTYALSAAGSFFKSTPGGSVFSASNSGLTASNIRAVAVHPTNNSVLMAGWGDVGFYASPALFRSIDRGVTWARANLGLNLDEVRTVVMDPNTAATVAGTTMYAGGVDRAPFGRLTASYSAGIAKSVDGGLNWAHPTIFTPAPVTLSRIGKVRSIALDKSSGLGVGGSGALQKVYFTGTGRVVCPAAGAGVVAQAIDTPRLWRSINAGADFVAIDSLPTGTCTVGGSDFANYPVPNPIVIDPLTPTTLYVGTYLAFGYDSTAVPAQPVPTVPSGVFKSIDSGASWTNVSTGLPRVITGNPASSARDVLALAINPINPQILYAAANPTSGTGPGRVYKTINGGANWTLSSTGISGQDVRALTIDPTDPTKIYAATGGNGSGPGGVYFSADSGVSWNSTSVNLPATSATALALDRSGADPILYAGTSNGVYDITQVADLDADGPPDVTEAAAPFGGDGNEDGILDAQQTNVASIAGAGAARSLNSPLDATVTISVSPQVGTCTRMNDAGSAEAEKIGPTDGEYAFPLGLIRFELLDCTSAFISVRYSGQSFGARFKFRNFGPEIAGNPGSVAWRNTAAGVTGNTWTFLLSDNAPGDNRDELGRILIFAGPGVEGIFANGFE